jgi:nucleotide-binding universal stress UspA family protein
MKILVTTDGSQRSLRILPHVARLGAVTGAEVIITRVLDPYADTADEPVLHRHEAIQRVKERWMQDLGAELFRAGGHGEAKIAIRGEGENVQDTILRFATEQDVDLIAIDSRGAGLLRHALVGSVAMDVIRKSPIPVMTTGRDLRPVEAAHEEYRIVATLDGSPASEAVLPALNGLLQDGAFAVTLLRVYQPALGDSDPRTEMAACHSYLAALRERLPANAPVDLLVREVLKGGGVDDVILDVARTAGADALAMATHGHRALRHLFLGSIALSVLGHSPVPVILTRHGSS